MANLSVRKLDDHIYEKLRRRAASHGISMEEEARQIISLVVDTPEKMSEVFQKHFGKKNGIDLKLSKRSPHQPMDFEE